MESNEFEKILGGVCAPEGFLACGVSCGIKKSKGLDLALVYSEMPAFAAGVFTTNKFSAAPVIYSKRCLENGQARAIVINSGNANAGTGKQGLDDARKMAEAVEDAMGIREGEVLVGSTGVIGEFMPMKEVLKGIKRAASDLSSGGNSDAAKAIMTTDTRIKEVAVEMEIDGRVARMGAMAKGAGMIHPNLATMLAVITTDLPLAPDLMAEMLAKATQWSFNRISVDGDQSTNDSVFMLANGAAFPEGYVLDEEGKSLAFRALCFLAGTLALEIVRDGEGTTKVLLVRVEGARNEEEAVTIADSIARSNLFKCAMHGGTASWGRIAAAAGSSGAQLDAQKLKIYLGGEMVCENGASAHFNQQKVSEALSKKGVDVLVDLGIGRGSAYYLTTDISPEFVRLNSKLET